MSKGAAVSSSAAFPIEGGCACRAVRYRLESGPLFVHCCHCRWCQRESGASFALNALIEADRVVALADEPEVVLTPSHSGKGQKIARCPKCRVAVWSHYAGAGDAIRFVTGRDKPLAAYVFSDDAAIRRRWETETSSGALTFGAPILHLTVPDLPFGGVGESGQGAYHGERSFRTFSHEKAVLSKPLAVDTLGPTIMPPFTPTKDRLVRRWLSKLM